MCTYHIYTMYAAGLKGKGGEGVKKGGELLRNKTLSYYILVHTYIFGPAGPEKQESAREPQTRRSGCGLACWNLGGATSCGLER